MATLNHPKGRSVTVPDDAVDYYLSKGWVEAGSAPAEPEEVVIPDGEPEEGWTNPQLKAYAERESIDLAGATKKADLLAAIAAGVPLESDDGSDDGNTGS